MRVPILILALGLGLAAASARSERAVVVRHGADVGTPLLHRYASAELGAHPGNLDVLADPSGLVYAGNYEGLLRFAGGEFELLTLPGAAPARGLARGRDDRLYVASYDHFGVVEASDDGTLVYTDLRPAFALEGREAFVGSVWSVHALHDAVYFHAGDRLYRYHYDGRGTHFALPPQTRAFHDTGRRLFTRVEGVGIQEFRDGRLHLLAGGELFADRPLDLLIADGDALILLSRQGGFHRVAGDAIHALGGESATLFERHVPYAFARLHDGSLAIGTLSGELLVFSADLELRQRYALGVYSITGMDTDREHGLWVATQGGLMRLQLPSPWSAIVADDGLPGQVAATAWYQGRLWIGGANGLVRGERDDLGETRLVPHGHFEYDVWDLAVTPAGLIAATTGALFRVTAQGVERVLDLEDPYFIVPSPDRPERLLVAGEDTLWVVSARADAIELLQTITLDGVSIAALEALADDSVWVGDYRGAPWRLRLAGNGRDLIEGGPVEVSDVEFDREHGSVPFQLDGTVYVLSGRHLLAWDGRGLKPSEGDGLAALIERPGELDLAQTAHGSYALTRHALYRRAQPGADWQRLRIDSPLARGFEALEVDDDGVLRLLAWNGILQYRPGTSLPSPPAPGAALRAVLLRDGDEERALPLAPPTTPEFPAPAHLSFRFEMLGSEPKPCFRTRLTGIDRGFGACTRQRSRDVVALPPGDYRFELEAETPAGQRSSVVAWAFRVSPHWYQTRWSRLLAALLLGLSVFLIALALARRRHRKLAAANRALEQRINERTLALEEANRRLKQLATEDSLTGVANRRALDQGLAREWLRCADRKLPLSVLMMDVDHFKSFNDRHGHVDGDRLLRDLARHLAAQVDARRELLARYGGEEFVLVLPDCPIERALERAEALRRSVAEGDFPVTLSIGVACAVPQAGHSGSQLVRRADGALYRAKEAGRNRVEQADQERPTRGRGG